MMEIYKTESGAHTQLYKSDQKNVYVCILADVKAAGFWTQFSPCPLPPRLSKRLGECGLMKNV